MADKFGETSVQAANAAKKAAELKDRVGDAKALTDAFNPDKKFQAFSSALSGVAGGFSAVQGAMGLMGAESKDLEKTMLKVQSAMALSQGLSAITEAQDSFKNLKTVAVDAFKGIKTAIGSTGIGLLVIALGAIYAYWDDIKAAVSGVSEEQEKLNVKTKANLDAENHILPNEACFGGESIAVTVRKLDDVIGNLRPIMIKIDVEGFESQVIKGGLNTFNSPSLLVILIELNGSGSRYGYSEDSIKSTIVDYGFTPNKYDPLTRSLIPISIHGASNHGNILFIRDIDKVQERLTTSLPFNVFGRSI
jgi:FkbM family methyltransferase